MQYSTTLKIGGQIKPLKCDHARDEEVYGVVDTIKREQGGRLDLLVNNAFQIAALDTMTGKPFWEQGAAVWDPLMQVGLRSHYVAACAAAPLLVETAARKQAPAAPAVINIGSFGGVSYVFNVAYGDGNAGVDRLSKDMAIELRPKGVACFSCWPGVVMTERMASIKAEDEEKWQTVMGVGEGCVRVIWTSGIKTRENVRPRPSPCTHPHAQIRREPALHGSGHRGAPVLARRGPAAALGVGPNRRGAGTGVWIRGCVGGTAAVDQEPAIPAAELCAQGGLRGGPLSNESRSRLAPPVERHGPAAGVNGCTGSDR